MDQSRKSKVPISIAIVVLTLLLSIGLLLTTAGSPAAVAADTTSTVVSTQLNYGGLNNPDAIAFDSAGNMYILNSGAQNSGGTASITVVAKHSGIIFGQYIRANTPTVLKAAKGLYNPVGIVFDSAGNMYIANGVSDPTGEGSITVVAKHSGIIFGQYIQANTPTMLNAATGLDNPSGIAFNSGDMYVANGVLDQTGKGNITVMAKHSGIIFGQYIQANKATMLDAARGFNNPANIAFNSGDMYITSEVFAPNYRGNITVIAKRSGRIFGQYIRANKATVLDVTKKVVFPIGIAFDSVGNMYMTSFNNSNASGVGFVTVIAKHSGAIFGQYIRANKATVLKTINPALASPFPLTTTFDSAGNMYIGSPTSNSIYVVGNHRLDFSKSTLPSATLNTHYSAHLSASGGIFGYDWYLSRGKLPNGLHLNSLTGQITGTPNKTGTSSFSVTVLDLAGEYKTENLSISVAAHQ